MVDVYEIAKLIEKKIKERAPTNYQVLVTSELAGQVRFSNNEITVVKHWNETYAEVFFERNKRVIATEIRNLKEENIDNFIDQLNSISKVIPENPDFIGLAEGPFDYSGYKFELDREISNIEDKGPDIVEKAINASLEAGAKRSAGALNTSLKELFLITSNGIEARDMNSMAYLHIRSFVEEETAGIGVTTGTKLDDLNPELAGKRAGEKAKMGVKPQTIEPGKYDIILGRPALGNLLSYTGMFASAFYIQMGFSFLAQKPGTKVASEKVTLYDNGRLPTGMFSRKCDDEGVPTRKTPIIEKGIIKSYLHNTSTAKKFNTESTGNAGIIVPHPWNLVLEGGDYSEDELISDIKKGIYIENATYTRFQNFAMGQFSSILRDGIFLIENGEITKAIKGARLSDTIPNILRNIDGLSKDTEQVFHWWMAYPVITPIVRARGIGITRSTK